MEILYENLKAILFEILLNLGFLLIEQNIKTTAGIPLQFFIVC